MREEKYGHGSGLKFLFFSKRKRLIFLKKDETLGLFRPFLDLMGNNWALNGENIIYNI